MLATTPADDPLRTRLAAAQETLARAQEVQATSETASKTADSDLSASIQNLATFYNDLADQAKTKVSALEAIEVAITRNDYARFIRRLMMVGATSSARPETSVSGTAVPNAL